MTDGRAAARLLLVTLLVREYDEAIDWYRRALGLRLAIDEPQGGGKRWVVVEDEDGRGLLLARARTPDELALVGRQHGGRVGFFLSVGDFDAAVERLRSAGGGLDEDPRDERYGRVAVFSDLYGNKWDMIQPTGDR